MTQRSKLYRVRLLVEENRGEYDSKTDQYVLEKDWLEVPIELEPFDAGLVLSVSLDKDSSVELAKELAEYINSDEGSVESIKPEPPEQVDVA